MISSPNQHQQQPDNVIPSIFEDDGVMLSHLLSQQQLLGYNSSFSASNPSPATAAGKGRRKRTPGKKDRHSKICTAQGLRDRRMRLSLHIARRFFDLQDMLGFDKASRTIEWLLAESKTAIKELKDSLLSPDGEFSRKKTEPAEGGKKRVVGREAREKARARARERTREKILEKSRHSSSIETSHTAVESNNVDRPNSNSEEDLLGFDQNWDISNTQSFGGAVEQKPSSISSNAPNPSSDEEPNPNVNTLFSNNPVSDFFCGLNF